MIAFNDFWNTYDKKVGDKAKIQTKWTLLAMHHQDIMIHLKKFIPSQRNKQYRPDPSTYLNQRRWENEIISEDKPPEVYIPTPTHKLVDPIRLTQDTTGVATHAKTQIEHFYKTGEISDLGNVIYRYLLSKGIIDFTEQRKEEIAEPIRYEATRRRKRTEDAYVGNVESEIEKELLRVYLTENVDILVKL